jgi:hypothetical protein
MVRDKRTRQGSEWQAGCSNQQYPKRHQSWLATQMLYHQRLTDLVNGHASNERQQLVKNEVHGCNVDTKKPRRSGAGESSAEHVSEEVAVVGSAVDGGVCSVDGVAILAGDGDGDAVCGGEEGRVAEGSGVVHGSRVGALSLNHTPCAAMRNRSRSYSVTLSQSRLINPLRPSSLVAALLR